AGTSSQPSSNQHSAGISSLLLRLCSQQREALRSAAFDVCPGRRNSYGPDTADDLRTFRDADRAASVKDVENVGTLQTALVGGQNQVLLQKPLRFFLEIAKHPEVQRHIGRLEIVSGKLKLIAMANLAVGHVVAPGQIVDVLNVVEKHRDPFRTVGDF